MSYLYTFIQILKDLVNMSSRQDFSKPLPKYDDSKSFSDYEETVFQVLMTESTHAYEHVKTGIPPSFPIPAIDLYVAVANRVFAAVSSASTAKKNPPTPGGPPTPPAAIQPPDLPANLPGHWMLIPLPVSSLPSWSSLNNIMDADYKDRQHYYQLQRNPKYYGQQGYDIWKDVKSCVIRAKYLFDNQEKQKVWSLLFNCIPSNYQDKIVILSDYTISLSLFDYVWLWKNIKFAITGEGPQSIPLLITKLMSTKMTNNDFSSFARNYTQLLNDIKSRKLTGDQLVTLLFDTIFYSGLVGPTNTILRPQVDRIFEDAVWPPAAESITKFSKLLTTREKVETAYAGEGVIKANLAKTSARKASYSKPSVPGSTSLCWNCARTGHICTNCKAPISTCNICSGTHHTLAHDSVKAAELRAQNKSKSVPSTSDPANRNRRVAANMTDRVTYDDTYDDEQYAAMTSLSVNLTSFTTEDEQVSADAAIDDYSDDEPPESIYGFNTFIIRGGSDSDSDNDSLPDLVSDTDSDDNDSLPDLVDDSDDEASTSIHGNIPEAAESDNDLVLTSTDDPDDHDAALPPPLLHCVSRYCTNIAAGQPKQCMYCAPQPVVRFQTISCEYDSDDDIVPELVATYSNLPGVSDVHANDNEEGTYVKIPELDDEYVNIELDEEILAVPSRSSEYVMVAPIYSIQQRLADYVVVTPANNVFLNHSSWQLATNISAMEVNIHIGPSDIVA